MAMMDKTIKTNEEHKETLKQDDSLIISSHEEI